MILWAVKLLVCAGFDPADFFFWAGNQDVSNAANESGDFGYQAMCGFVD